jgi:hypothetical protein
MYAVLEYFQHFFHSLAMKVDHIHSRYCKEHFDIIMSCVLAGAHLAEETRGAGRAGKTEKRII